MHLLTAQPGTPVGEGVAVDLGQTPGELVVLSAADSELACLAAAYDRLVQQHGGPNGGRQGTGVPTLRLANLLQLGHHLSVDLYVEGVIAEARLVVVRLLGGVGYWPYGVEQIAETCRRRQIPLALLPGDDQPDPELARLSTVAPESAQRLWQYLAQGGLNNALSFLGHAGCLCGWTLPWLEPAPLPRAALYWPGLVLPDLEQLRQAWGERNPENAPVAALVFYRALVQAANLAAVDALVEALQAQGLRPLPVALTSLKDPLPAALLDQLFTQAPPAVILNATAFSVTQPGHGHAETAFDRADCPVLQVIFAGQGEAEWREGRAGLQARDIAMNVALPEIDGRIIARAVSFKAEAQHHQATQCRLLAYRPVPDRIAFTAALAAAWARLRQTPRGERRIAIVLANYPNRDGRLANGVGLDTPAGVVAALQAMAAAGYDVGQAPPDGAALMAELAAGVTTTWQELDQRQVSETLALEEYRAWFGQLPATVQERVTARWGAPEADPFVRGQAFCLPARRYGRMLLAVQPSRGLGLEPSRSYHDPELPPPHHYLAFYWWLRRGFQAHALIHFGKHGNLEWLPGKAVALSAECFPDLVLGPLPNLYPFIVNDPGEGTQAKRRTAAVIIDHLTPPLTRAETYGPLRDLEILVDEYYEASGVDARRLPILRERILELSAAIGLDRDLGLERESDPTAALSRIDNHLCELKELQIRDGLHIFGRSPEGDQLTDLLLALTRLPRARGLGRDASLIRALALDHGYDFDPLEAAGQGAEAPAGPQRREALDQLETLARTLIAGVSPPAPDWSHTHPVLDYIQQELRPLVAACGPAEMAGLLKGLDGRFVPPGPSGAPTRGRPEVLPTGRNFYAVDSRAVPTPAAWSLGWKSATLVIERYLQEHGDWPRTIALTAWGTANMRTGGDDIAQALALMGVRPTWDAATGRVTGFEIMPISVLDRPRVDVTLRISGFFRDAFPAQIALVDAAVRAVAALDEADDQNPLAARFRRDRAALEQSGVATEEATRRAGYRIFGSAPGAYGAGLDGVLDRGQWQTSADLGEAYLAWGGYAYGAETEGTAERSLFEARLKAVRLVLHNQDNREHDLFDSDGYYQFEGGLTAAVQTLAGAAPAVFHNDHSQPERPRVLTLDEEVARVVRARVVNPKWLAGVRRHGYKGASEMAATVDYLFAFAATSGAVKSHHFDAVFEAYLADDEVRGFVAEANPAALREISRRLSEALERGLWRPRSNSAFLLLDQLGTRT